MDVSYPLTPFVAWLVAGSLKFVINSLRAGRLAFGLIGYGGMPSNHSAIVTSMAALIGLREGVDNGMFGVAVTLAFIVILDAKDLRRHIGRQAVAINLLARGREEVPVLRERMGHSGPEILGGIVVGIFTAWIVNSLGRMHI